MLHQPAPAAPLRATAVRKADDGLSEALDAIARRLEPAIRRAFEEAVARMHARVDATALRRAAEAGDAQAALAAVGLSLEGEELTPMLRPLGRAFEAGARLAPQAVPEARLVFTFDAGAARAVRALREYGLALVRQVAGDTREATRDILTDQLRRGVNPRSVAARIGEVVGLTTDQARAVQRFRLALVQRDRSALEAKLRDRRFDPTIRRAVEGDGSLSGAQIDRVIARYAERMRQHRGEVIARTESMRAANLGLHQGLAQAIDAGQLPEAGLTRRWVVAKGERTCPTCRAVPRLNPAGVPVNVPFRTTTGAVMRPPLHPQCRCVCTFALAVAASP